MKVKSSSASSIRPSPAKTPKRLPSFRDRAKTSKVARRSAVPSAMAERSIVSS